MDAIKYPTRCNLDIFGYCDANREGFLLKDAAEQPKYVAATGKCSSTPEKCGHYKKNSEVNPFRPELVAKP